MSVLSEKIKADSPDTAEIAAWLDSLDNDARIAEARSLGPGAQKKLWILCAGGAMALTDFVTTETPDMTSVRHYGRNTLPVFKVFEKRFCRAPEGTETEGLWGYNEGSTRGLVGPGYFVCRETGGDERGAIVIDYTLVPGGKCEEWPEIEPNEKGVSRFVYSGMQDFMRPISAHVSIGRAYIKGKESNNYFVLCRESS